MENEVEKPRNRLERMFQWAELPEREDIYTWKGTTKWGNHDLYPIDKSERTYGWMGYFAIWFASGISISSVTLGSAYVAYGLTAGETLGAVLGGTVIASIIAWLCARPGMDYHIGYTVWNRVGFGMRGTYIPMFVVALGGMVFAGIQAYYGGQAAALILSAIFPSFHSMENTLPLSAAITTKNLIGMIVYTAIFLIILWFTPPHKLKRWLYPSAIIVGATFIGIVAWAVNANGGSPGNLVSGTLAISKSQRAFRIVQCISSISGSYGGAADRISDWTRFEKRRGASTPAMLLAMPISITLVALIGVVIATCTNQIYGEVIWNPLVLLTQIQTDTYTAKSRAGTFFAGFGLLTSQIFIQLSQNTIPYGMDVAGLFPRYVSMKRGAVFLTLIVVAINPWRFLSQASIFVTILSSFTVFHGAQTPIILSDYWIMRKGLLKLPDLYTENGIYWYSNGWNFRMLFALIVGMVPALPGFFITVIRGPIDHPAVKMFQISWFIVAPLSLILYVGACYIWPLPGLGVQEFINPEDNPRVQAVIEGQEIESQRTAVLGKTGIDDKVDELSNDSRGEDSRSA